MALSYREALEFIYSFTDYEKLKGYRYSPEEFNLARMEKLLEFAGNPHTFFRSLHVAGTKGKGSTCAIMESVLRAQGYRTGLYTSPHLHTFRERIRIAGELVSEEDVASGIEELRPLIEKVPGLTTFEIMTALAFFLFAHKGVEVAVVEVGLGGRLDATNVITPMVSVITSIGYDHMQLLGNTLASIAREKAGIIKKGIPVVSAPQEEEALLVIEETARLRGSPLILAGRDWVWEDVEKGREDQVFTVKRLNPPGFSVRVRLPLLGVFQPVNATVAVAALDQARSQGLQVTDEAIVEGLEKVKWPGRLEVLQNSPLFIVDGAHNVDSARRLAQSLRELFSWNRFILVFGASSDKDIPGMLKELLPLADVVFFTRARNPRAASPEAILKEAQVLGFDGKVVEPANKAVEEALKEALAEDVVCVTGSLFLVAEARETWAIISGKPLPPTDPI
ncbi:MAG: folylpolyglutamate synthase/dihydrofolate synthase family protein [Anaerolineae bacterium]|nr:bifunctional folylpolyglutamate synthase/dihydrofolate synthase [Anaerolineae bacterium]MDW8102168.1 folylpolyglutamate synthase/dihydrofolate synthase family protein [Anaerolineae bacterium]